QLLGSSIRLLTTPSPLFSFSSTHTAPTEIYTLSLHDALPIYYVPTGKVKWYDGEKGFGFLTRDDGGDEVFVHSTSLPPGTTSLRSGQRVECGVAEGRKGAQALQVRLLDTQHSVVKARRKKPDEMVVITEDLIKLLEGLSNGYRRGRQPESREASKIASVLRVVADELET